MGEGRVGVSLLERLDPIFVIVDVVVPYIAELVRSLFLLPQ